MKRTFESYSYNETKDIAAGIAKEAAPGMVFALDGDLGAGKTAFSQGFARGLGVTEPVNSPTFTILNIYESGSIPLYHFDVYRIGDIDEMDEIGYEDFFYSRGICLVEWAGMIEELLPDDTVRINIYRDDEKGFDYRRIEVLG